MLRRRLWYKSGIIKSNFNFFLKLFKMRLFTYYDHHSIDIWIDLFCYYTVIMITTHLIAVYLSATNLCVKLLDWPLISCRLIVNITNSDMSLLNPNTAALPVSIPSPLSPLLPSVALLSSSSNQLCCAGILIPSGREKSAQLAAVRAAGFDVCRRCATSVLIDRIVDEDQSPPPAPHVA